MYLLILEENPVEIKYYAIPAVEKESEWYILEHAHNRMVNCDDDNDEYALKLNGFLEKGREGVEKYFAGKWAQYEIDVSELPKRSFLGVYKSGFFL